MACQRNLAVASLGGAEDEVRVWHAASLEGRGPECTHQQGHCREDPDGTRTPFDEPDRTSPDTGPVDVLLTFTAGIEPGSAWPERDASQQAQQSREQGEGREHGEDDADGGHRSQHAVGFQIAQHETEQSRNHGATRGGNRFYGAQPSLLCGLPFVRVLQEFFTITRYIKQ